MADLAAQPTSIQSVYNWFLENRLFVNRRYQRKLVWTLEEKQKLIDSILNKYPVPAILIAEKEDAPGSYEIIDGLQRLHAILSFIETSFPTEDGSYFNLEYFPTAKGRADSGAFFPKENGSVISQRQTSTILDYSLAISVMRNASEYEINDVFDRINTYGHRLSDQERRQAGVRNEFSALVRNIACNLRGDVSSEILPLSMMPSISIDLPMTKHGYSVKADEVFWVNQGILRSTDLRDSMDEQCIADIAGCIVGGQIIERSKDALDEIYLEGSPESERVLNALEVYGAGRLSDEFTFCIQEVLKVCESEKLRDIVYGKKGTNAFPSVFAIIFIAFHELFTMESKKILDYAGVRKSIDLLSRRINTDRSSTVIEERRKNIDTVKGLISPFFISEKNLASEIYSNHTTVDIEAVIRRSEIELANYELKQGLLSLANNGKQDPDIIAKVVRTISAIANNGPSSLGKIIIGVTDREEHAHRIQEIDGIEAKKVGRRFVVGVNREAKRLGISTESYFAKWKEGIRKSDLTNTLKDAVLSNMDYNSYYGLGIIVITIPPQLDLSYVGEELYWRESDSTIRAEGLKKAADLAKRFMTRT